MNVATLEEYYDHLPNVVSIIGFGISILFLCTHLIVFSITEDMWTMTGNSLASFCLALLLSYCTYIGGMIVENKTTPCTIIAILAYYFFLTTSAWLLSISAELYSTVKKIKSRRYYENKNTCRFMAYSMFSWVQPAAVLGIALYLESHNILKMPKKFQVDLFPAGSNCFHRKTSMLLWFLIFFNINLILTFLVSALTAFIACGTKDRQVQRNDDFFTVLKYYMRLSLLVGIVWILGMCMIHFKEAILHIGFAIANGVLGLYIFLVFTFNNKISSVVFHDDKHYALKTFQSDSRENEISSISATVARSPIISDV